MYNTSYSLSIFSTEDLQLFIVIHCNYRNIGQDLAYISFFPNMCIYPSLSR